MPLHITAIDSMLVYNRHAEDGGPQKKMALEVQ